MAARVTHAHFERYAQAKLEFVRNVAALAERPDYLESLLDEDAFGALKVLLSDRVPTIQQTAALAVGRMASFSVELAEELVRSGILEQLTRAMDASELPGHLKAGAFVLRSVARHSAELCACALSAGAAATVVHCLAQVDVTVREAAAGAASALASHAGEQAGALIAAGALPLLVAALAEPEPPLRRVAALALADIAKHAPELAEAAVDAGALPPLVALLRQQGGVVVGGGEAGVASAALAAAKVRRAGVTALGAIVKHSPALAEAAVSEGRLFPALLTAVGDTSDEPTRRGGATCLREVVKHSEALASVAVEAGSIGACVQYLDATASIGAPGVGALASTALALTAVDPAVTAAAAAAVGGATSPPMGEAAVGAARGAARLPAVMALGFISAYSDALALRAIESGAVAALKDALLGEGAEDHVRGAAVWALGQVGKHSSRHARALAAADVLRHILALLQGDGSGGVATSFGGGLPASDDLRDKARRCLTAVIGQCDHVPALIALLPPAPLPLAKLILKQLCATLKGSSDARKGLLASGALKLVQRLDPNARAAVARHGPSALRALFTSAGGGGGAAVAVSAAATLNGGSGAMPSFAPAHAGSALAAVAAGGGDDELSDLVSDINALFPADVVAYCRPAYGLELTARAEAEGGGGR